MLSRVLTGPSNTRPFLISQLFSIRKIGSSLSTDLPISSEVIVRAIFHKPYRRPKLRTFRSDISKYTSRRIGPSSLSYTGSMDADDATQHRRSDFTRLARHLCGKSIGLVLGGGGARGISQVGVIRALEEAGISIDIVGGTSIGAFNAGLYAKDADSLPIYGRAKKFAGRMASLWRLAMDLTWPTTSYTTGHEVLSRKALANIV